MDNNSVSDEVSVFRKFIRDWYFLIMLAVAVLFIVVVGGAMRNNAIQASQNVPPDIRAEFSHCKVIDKQSLIYRVTNYYVETSCGRFNIAKDKFANIEKGLVYDLVTVDYRGDHRPYITEFKASSK